MLNKPLKMEYEALSLGGNIANLIATMISSDDLTLRVMVEIAKKDRLILEGNPEFKGNRFDVTYGITKKEIRENINFGERVATSGKRKGEKILSHPSDKTIDSIISFLTGATLVYYERHNDKKKRYLYTQRALEVIVILCEKGCLDKKEFISN